MVTFPTESGNPTNYLIDGTKGAQPKSVMYDLTKAAETAPSLLMVVIGNDIFFGQTKIENAQWTAAAAGGRAVSWTDAAQDDDASAPSSGHLIFAADGASVQGNFVHAGTAYSATGAVRESGDVSVWELYQGVLSMLQEPELRPRIEEAFLELESQQKYREYTCDVAEASAACIVTVAGQRLWVNGIEAHNVAWQQLPDGAARVLWYPQDNDADSAPGGKPHAADVTFTLDMSAFSGTCQQAEPRHSCDESAGGARERVFAAACLAAYAARKKGVRQAPHAGGAWRAVHNAAGGSCAAMRRGPHSMPRAALQAGRPQCLHADCCT
eukprot:TRINITY_DN2054_c0_g1_i14.p1 TRINITY_DN2054_c0_g1~~TRINITY_DN2054_c0_g1_i14.p1  ORF type:complete len:325 (-),score=60.77 TRINITY_DN2054_c0_g1_i14:789-1763(-)